VQHLHGAVGAGQEPVVFSEDLDRDSGSIRARGHLTAQGVDLLRGAVLALRFGGHRRVILDLEGVRTADVRGLHLLRSLQAAVTADGGDLILLHAPGRL
jgi:anti-anti-sigma regulatory factor